MNEYRVNDLVTVTGFIEAVHDNGLATSVRVRMRHGGDIGPALAAKPAVPSGEAKRHLKNIRRASNAFIAREGGNAYSTELDAAADFFAAQVPPEPVDWDKVPMGTRVRVHAGDGDWMHANWIAYDEGADFPYVARPELGRSAYGYYACEIAEQS